MKMLCLISDGIDSPVAAYLMLCKKHDVEFLHFDLGSFITCNSREKAKKLIKKLEQRTGKKLKIHFINHRHFLSRIAKKADKKYTCILCKRQMFRLAENLAKKINAKAILTGDSLGQVASQTLENMYIETKAVEIPVIRPLIGLHKNDVIKLARKIGTYKISTSNKGTCKAVPKKPETRASLGKIKKQEEKLK